MSMQPTTVQRLPDWPERLAAFIDGRRCVPFAWGRNDCVLFAADALHTVTGQDPLAAVRGQWASEAQALQVLRHHRGLAWAVLATLGRPLRSAALAPRGAVVLARMRGLPILGVQLGAVWCAPGPCGLEFRPAAEVRLAWGF